MTILRRDLRFHRGQFTTTKDPSAGMRGGRRALARRLDADDVLVS
jgi:hypothetical protein